MREYLLALALFAALPASSVRAQEVSDQSIASFFEGVGIGSQVVQNQFFQTPFGSGMRAVNLELFTVKVGTPAWVEMGLPEPVEPEPWPTPMEYKASNLGRTLYGLLNELTPGQREVLKARLSRPNPNSRELDEVLRLITNYIQPMQNARSSAGATHAQLYPEDFKAFYTSAKAALARIPEKEDAPAAAAAAAPKAPARSTEEVLRMAKAQAELRKGLLGARQFLGGVLDSSQASATSRLAARQAAGANEEEVRQLQSKVQFMNWLNGPKTRKALSANPQTVAELDLVVAAINDMTKPGGDGKTHRQEALYPLVRFIHESQLTQEQWSELQRRFPMGDSIDRMGWAKLWRAGITGRMPDGTSLEVGVIGSGVDDKHPLLAGRVKQADMLTSERRLDASKRPVPALAGTHETMVASVIASALPESRLISYKNLDDDDAAVPPWRNHGGAIQYGDSVVRAVDAARRDRVAAVNLSQGARIGMGIPRNGPLEESVERAHAAGIPVTSASGNDGPGAVSVPSAVTFSVGSLDANDQQSSFSSDGDIVRVLPDGTVRLETKPQIMAPGELNMAKYDPTGKYEDPAKLYEPSEGTSFASPWVTAAMAALEQVARERGVSVSVEEKMDILTSTGRAIDSPIHPLGVPSLNPVAAVAELERRISLRKPKTTAGAEIAGRKGAADILSPSNLTAKLMNWLGAGAP